MYFGYLAFLEWRGMGKPPTIFIKQRARWKFLRSIRKSKNETSVDFIEDQRETPPKDVGLLTDYEKFKQKLSEQQATIFQLLREDYNRREIAEKLNIAYVSVTTQIARIRDKWRKFYDYL